MSSDLIIEDEATTAPRRKPGRKLILIGAAAAVVLLGGGGGAYMMLGGKKAAAAEATAAAPAGDGAKAEEKDGESKHGGKEAGPFDVPPLLVNLRSPDGAAHFLKLHIMLVPGPKATEATFKDELPALIDAYQPFLRELRPEDLSGSAAVYRIKEELLIRARQTIGAGKVEDVLIQDLVQQ